MDQFALGFVYRPAAMDAVRAAGRLCQLLPYNADEIPPAFSLSQYRLRPFDQGPVGSCWCNSSACAIEILAGAQGHEAFPVSRHLLGYAGKGLEGGGNMCNGGDPTDALMAATSEKGVGVGHEDLDPYRADSRYLGAKPPQAVYDDAKKHAISGLVQINSDDDAMRFISSGRPIVQGQWWAYSLDSPKTFMDSIGAGQYGHSLAEIGYAKPGVFDEYGWIQITNSHGLIYPPLPADKAAKVPGYKPNQPDKTCDYWIRVDVYQRIKNHGNMIRVGITDTAGFGTITTVPSFFDSFAV